MVASRHTYGIAGACRLRDTPRLNGRRSGVNELARRSRVATPNVFWGFHAREVAVCVLKEFTEDCASGAAGALISCNG